MSSFNTSLPASKPAPIHRLDESVINRIAAGEIIQRPSNALKELIENSLDAGATSITIAVKDGGLKLLQIQDNGHGIRKEDLAIVCERHTTSKLKVYEDLSTIQTYGFRGEALASISHVSHLTLTTKQADSECAYRARYSDGVLVQAKPGESSNPEPCAGNNGTIIAAEDLFYNISSRKSALKNARNEYNSIFEVASRYAIHNSGVAFTCRKMDSVKADLNTQQGASVVNNIRQVFGFNAAECLVKVEHEDAGTGASFTGLVSNAAHVMHKSVFLLFINHRLVDNSQIKQAVEALYGSVMPKGSRPFVYLDLQIKPENVDVNVHPTKREVRFLHEDTIIGSIVATIHKKVANTNSSRSYQVQSSIVPGTGAIELARDDSSLFAATVAEIASPSSDTFAKTPVLAPDRTHGAGVATMSSNLSDIASSPLSGRTRGRAPTLDRSGSSISQSFTSTTPQKTPVSRTVRTDYKNLSLDSFMFGSSPSIKRGHVQSTIETDFSVTPIKQTPTRVPFKISSSHANTASSPKSDHGNVPFASNQPSAIQGSSSDIALMSENIEPPLVGDPVQTDADSPSRMRAPPATLQSQMPDMFPAISPGTASRSYITAEKEPRVDVRLTSILNMRKELQRQIHPEMTQILNEHTFVGFVDDRRALIQHQTRLYMVDFCKISFHLFHHRIIFDIMNYGRLMLDPPAPIRDLALVAARELGNPANADEIADQISVRFGDSREMLEEYFHIRIDDTGCIESLPMIVRDFSPDYDKLPLFLHNATFSVNWDDEQQFFRSFSNVLAALYAVEPPLPSDSQNAKEEYRMVIEHRVLPAMKGGSFWAPSLLLTENALVQLVDVPDLYRIFERC